MYGEAQTWSRTSIVGSDNLPVADRLQQDPRLASFKINYRVRDIAAMLAQLKAAGATTSEKVDDCGPMGRFGYATDPEGNRFELWQPGT